MCGKIPRWPRTILNPCGVSHETPPQHAFCDNANTWLSKDGECVCLRAEGRELGKFPIHTIGALVCFGQVTCSSFLARPLRPERRRRVLAHGKRALHGLNARAYHGQRAAAARAVPAKRTARRGRFLWPAPSSPVRLSIAARCCGERPENIPRTTPTAAWPESAKVSHPVCNVLAQARSH